MEREALQQYYQENAVNRGSYELANAGDSAVYVDVKGVLGDPVVGRATTRELAALLPDDVTCIACEGEGGAFLGASLRDAVDVALTRVRSTEKEYGMERQIEGYQPTSEDVVAVADDVWTTGGSARSVWNTIQDSGATLAGYYVVCYRGDDPVPDTVSTVFTLDELL